MFPRAASLFILPFVLVWSGVASAATRETFESAQPTWRLVDADCRAQVVTHQRTFVQPHSGQACEHMRLQCGRGSKIHVGEDIQPARIISELNLGVWIKSNRPGIQLLARVVFPRAEDPDRGGPITRILRGSTYSKVGSWQRLKMENVERLLADQTRLARAEYGAQVDPRGAYIDVIMLNVYTGSGLIDVWIDDLEIEPHVTTEASSATVTAPAAQTTHVEESTGVVSSDASPSSGSSSIRLKGSILEVDGRPFMLRMIEHNGESFESLHALGFNAVRLRAPPTQSQATEAERLGIWIVAPPPQAVGRNEISLLMHRVLAWDLGEQLTQAELEATRSLAGEVRLADPQRGRPLITGADQNLWDYSRISDVTLLDLAPLGTSFELSDYRAWLVDRMRLARGGRPIWAAIQTESHARLAEQADAMGLNARDINGVEPDQIRMLVYEAVAAGVRGLFFRSRSRLDAVEPAARLRADMLRLVNNELTLIEPWVASGSYGGEIKSTDERVRISALTTDRSRLLLITRQAADQQYVMSPPKDARVSFEDNGASRSDRAYEITPTSFTPAHYVRNPGGLRVVLDDVGWTSLIVMSSDQLVISYVVDQQRRVQQAAAKLRFDIESRRLAALEEFVRSNTPPNAQTSETTASVRIAKDNLRRCEQMLASADYRSAYQFGERAARAISAVRHSEWQRAVSPFSSPAASPLCHSFESLPLHWDLTARMPTMRWTVNALAGGDFENLDFMQSRGWRYERSGNDDLLAAVNLSSDAARDGNSGLHLRCWPTDEARAPQTLETAPVRITSAPVPVRQGQLVRIHGWVRMAEEVEGSQDGLLIYDSFGGPSLGERIHAAADWQEFTLYRAAPRDGQLILTFALTGMGAARVDNITIMLGEPPVIRSGSSRSGD